MKIEAFAPTNFGRTLKQRKLTKANAVPREKERPGEKFPDYIHTRRAITFTPWAEGTRSEGDEYLTYAMKFTLKMSATLISKGPIIAISFFLQFSTLPSVVFSLPIYACFHVYTNVATIFATFMLRPSNIRNIGLRWSRATTFRD